MKQAARTVMALMLSTIVVVALSAATAGGATTANGVDVNVKHAGESVERGTLPLEKVTKSGLRTFGMSAAAATAADPPVGTVRLMPVLDDFTGQYRFRGFTLRALGEHIEVWVQEGQPAGFPAGNAGNLNFPTGDCRNDGVRNVITSDQVASLIHEFDTVIYPKESATFSVPPSRDGSNATLPGLLGGVIPDDYYMGDGGKIMTLISNVRDSNYYDTNNANRFTYIAGFFSSQINGFFDRNVMTIDAFDWVHRTGANPPDAPSADACLSAPARPHLYEGVFAHEYQHLLESYEDSDEFNWINEGLSDWAQTLVGYVNPSLSINDKGFDSHIQCFLGWLSVATPVNPNPRAECGPENSLTRWLDQGDPEVLADYGAAYSMMELLQTRYGTDFMTLLHRGDANGLSGLQEALDARQENNKVMSQGVLHDWALMVALDGLVGDKYHLEGHGVSKKDVTVPTLDATVNWDNPHAYNSPGGPSNGADYVRLRNGTGGYLAGADINSLSFSASKSLPAQPVAWAVDQNPPTTPGDAALYSGADNYRDEAIVRPITVPNVADPKLTFNAFWNEEFSWDFGFVQVSDDGGSTYTSLDCTDTTSELNEDALPTAVENVPGFTGFSGTFKPETCSLAAYKGQNVLLAFRAFNDPGTLGDSAAAAPGFWVDDIVVAGTAIPEGLAGWKSFTETKPNTVDGFTVWIVSMDTKMKGGDLTVKPLQLKADFSIKGNVNIGKYVDRKADFVGAIVFYDDPSEGSFQYAPYTLTVNGVVQPGGS